MTARTRALSIDGPHRSGAAGLDHAVRIIHAVCQLAGAPSLVADLEASFRQDGVADAVDRRDTAALFDWLVAALSFQGISDLIAHGYMERHGRATWADIAKGLATRPTCLKLHSYWQFYDCRYHKGSGTCAEPDHLPACPLPVHRLRNGRLNQIAYGLYLFVRDIAGGDLVGWIDDRLTEADDPTSPDRLVRLRAALLEPLGCVRTRC